jgi:hypothetical protein
MKLLTRILRYLLDFSFFFLLSSHPYCAINLELGWALHGVEFFYRVSSFKYTKLINPKSRRKKGTGERDTGSYLKNDIFSQD